MFAPLPKRTVARSFSYTCPTTQTVERSVTRISSLFTSITSPGFTERLVTVPDEGDGTVTSELICDVEFSESMRCAVIPNNNNFCRRFATFDSASRYCDMEIG